MHKLLVEALKFQICTNFWAHCGQHFELTNIGRNPRRDINWIIAFDTEWIDNWDWFLSGSSEFLYFRLNSRTWHRFLRHPNTHRRYYEDFLVMQAPLIRDLRRATVWSSNGYIHLLSYSPRSTGLPPVVDNIQHRVGNRVIRIPQLPWTMSTLRTSSSIEGLLLALRNGNSDGSFYPNEKVVHQMALSGLREAAFCQDQQTFRTRIAVNWEDKLVLFHV